jgi:hypothetical protein
MLAQIPPSIAEDEPDSGIFGVPDWDIDISKVGNRRCFWTFPQRG